MNKKKRLITGVSVIVVLLLYLALSTGTSNQFEVSSAVAQRENLTGKIIIVNGSMVPGTDKWDALNRTLTFKMTDGITAIDVIYRGDKPDIPPEATDIQTIVTGQFNGTVFESFRMLTKCPSKYEGEANVYPGNST